MFISWITDQMKTLNSLKLQISQNVQPFQKWKPLSKLAFDTPISMHQFYEWCAIILADETITCRTHSLKAPPLKHGSSEMYQKRLFVHFQRGQERWKAAIFIFQLNFRTIIHPETALPLPARAEKGANEMSKRLKAVSTIIATLWKMIRHTHTHTRSLIFPPSSLRALQTRMNVSTRVAPKTTSGWEVVSLLESEQRDDEDGESISGGAG